MGVNKDLNDVSDNLPKITLSPVSDEGEFLNPNLNSNSLDEETQMKNLYAGNFTDSTSQSESKC